MALIGTSRHSPHCSDDGRYRTNKGQTSALSLNGSIVNDPLRPIASISCRISKGPFLSAAFSRYGDGTAVRLSAPGAVRHDVAHQVAHVVLQISDDVLDDVSDRDHAHDFARVQHW